MSVDSRSERTVLTGRRVTSHLRGGRARGAARGSALTSLMLRKTASNFLAQVREPQMVVTLVGLLRLVPGGQVLLDEISRLLRSFRAIQDLRARIPKVVFVVRIRVAGENLIGAPEIGCKSDRRCGGAPLCF